MIRRIPVALTALSSVLVALVTYRFLLLGVTPQAFPSMEVHIALNKLAFIAHIAASPIALAIGAFQFMPKLRAKQPRLHRILGRIYGVAILVGGTAALVMAPNSSGGAVSVVGFTMLSILWVLSTAQAIRHAMARRFDLHRVWMIRSFAMTFAAVTLRIELQPLMLWAGMDYSQAIQITAWLSWVLNLIIAEWWISPRALRGKKTVAA